MSVFTFDDYRDYLKSYLGSLPKKGRGELSRIARHLAVNTTLLSQIMAGTREFSLEQTFNLSLYLNHTDLETDYFALLVQIERAGSTALRNHLEKKLSALRKEALQLSRRLTHEKKLSELDRSIFYSSWIYSAIHLYTSIKPKGVSMEDISNRFQISRARGMEVMKFLISSGLCKEHSGHFSMGVQSTFVPQGSPHLVKHHANWRVKAIQKSEALAETELMYTGQISLSRTDFHRIRDKMAEMLKSIMQTAKDSKSEEIACLNLDWFWIER